MPSDPRNIDASPEQRFASRLRELERRVAVLERAGSIVYSGSGPPTTALRTGALYVDTAANRLYVRDVANWRYIPTTFP